MIESVPVMTHNLDIHTNIEQMYLVITDTVILFFWSKFHPIVTMESSTVNLNKSATLLLVIEREVKIHGVSR